MDVLVLAVIGAVAGAVASFMLKSRGREANLIVCIVTAIVGALMAGLIVAPLLTVVGMPGGRKAVTDPLGVASYVFAVLGALLALFVGTLGDRRRPEGSA